MTINTARLYKKYLHLSCDQALSGTMDTLLNQIPSSQLKNGKVALRLSSHYERGWKISNKMRKLKSVSKYPVVRHYIALYTSVFAKYICSWYGGLYDCYLRHLQKLETIYADHQKDDHLEVLRIV